MNQSLDRLLQPVRNAARRFLQLPAPEKSYIGPLGCVRTAAQFITWNQVPGDYLEFGVFQGNSFATAYETISGLRKTHARRGLLAQSNAPQFKAWIENRPRFFAFDSFEGLPAGPATRQVDYQPGAYACTEADFRRNIAARGVDLNDVVIVKGFYDHTLNAELKRQHKLTRVAVAMIDCDLYESTVPVLDFLTDIVQQGTILIFDDWFRFQGNPRLGEQRAFREWEKRNPQFELIEYWREGPQAMSFLVNLR